ncbi:MAG: phosphoribosylamine--glycine ligase [Anaerovoracaceae bacterium]|jgi:phosphoribosylamine--glycine ligase
MKVLVVGGGGREHAIVKAIKANPKVETIYALPGNGGISEEAICVNIAAKDIEKMRDFAVEHGVDYVIVAPDDPLVMGAVDMLNQVGIPSFGPDKAAAIIEGSKIFSKDLMKRYGIPTAEYQVFNDYEEALEYVEGAEEIDFVIKADGLALGKGVIIPKSRQEAVDAIHSIMGDKIFGESGNRIVIEEFLTGPEVTVLSFCDGETLIPMISSMDHKRALDGDEGLNTGGMGVIAPNPYYTEEIQKQCMEEIFLPTVRAMKKEGRPFKGCLYFGLMLTPKGPKVIEYNCRFGDPETQAVLPLLRTDLLEVMEATTRGGLNEVDVEFHPGCSCCVVVASGGYPGEYKTGYEIEVGDMGDAIIYHGGTRKEGDKIVTSGGRVLAVTAIGEDLKTAVDKAYEGVDKIRFRSMHFRKDIGQRALRK